MTHLIVGLGNPAEYDGTRHNVGAELVARLAEHHAEVARPLSAPGFRGEAFRFDLKGEDVILVRRLNTYMNASGPAVLTIMNFFKIPPSDLLLIHDEVALPLGQLRLSFDASPAGHNGVRSVTSTLGSQAFLRLRLGIESRVGSRVPPTDDFVLEQFREEEEPLVDDMIERGILATLTVISEGGEAAMAKFNR